MDHGECVEDGCESVVLVQGGGQVGAGQVLQRKHRPHAVVTEPQHVGQERALDRAVVVVLDAGPIGRQRGRTVFTKADRRVPPEPRKSATIQRAATSEMPRPGVAERKVVGRSPGPARSCRCRRRWAQHPRDVAQVRRRRWRSRRTLPDEKVRVPVSRKGSGALSDRNSALPWPIAFGSPATGRCRSSRPGSAWPAAPPHSQG